MEEKETVVVENEVKDQSLEKVLWNCLNTIKNNIDSASPEQKTFFKMFVDEWYDKKSTAKERLHHEIYELSNRIDKLHSFLRKRDADGILMIKKLKFTDAQILLMSKQLEIMTELHDILSARYSIFDVKKEDEN